MVIRKYHLLMLGMTLLFVSTSCWAGGYPSHQDRYVNDYATLLTPEDAAGIRNMLIHLDQSDGIEGTLLTIHSIHEYDTQDETIETFATNLFNAWGIGNAKKNNGVLILVAVKDRAMRIEVGLGYGNSLDAAMKGIIQEFFLPEFKREKYSRGIYHGTREVISLLTGKRPEDQRSFLLKIQERASRWYGAFLDLPSEVRIGGGVVGGLLSLLSLIFGGRHYWRNRKRYCPNCDAEMSRLDEIADDLYLNDGQRKEEIIKSVDYDVWHCSACGTQTIDAYNNWFSSYKKCPQCQRRTMTVDRTTIDSPTYTSTGTGRETRDCKHCDYHHESTYTIPRLEKSENSGSSSSSSSSSGSSFGGGRSSGGGASGSW